MTFLETPTFAAISNAWGGLELLDWMSGNARSRCLVPPETKNEPLQLVTSLHQGGALLGASPDGKLHLWDPEDASHMLEFEGAGAWLS